MEGVLVVGAGFMGSGIAQVCAQAGYPTHLTDIEEGALQRASKEIEWSLEKLGRKGLLKDSPGAVFRRITFERGLESAQEVKWVVEAALEKADLKQEIFKALDQRCPAGTVLASNTSSIPISFIADATQRKERVLGLHFFGPVPLMGLVEVIQGKKTSQEVVEESVAFIRSLGKTPVLVKKDVPGFVMNRIFAAALREAIDLVEQGVVSLSDVDAGMRLGYGWKAGPFEIVDNAGLDTWALIERALGALGEDYLVPRSDLLERMVKEGRPGKKAGKGFYLYSEGGKRLE